MEHDHLFVWANDRRMSGGLLTWMRPFVMLLSVMLVTNGMVMTVGVGAAAMPVVAVYPPTWSEAQSEAATIRAGAPIVALGPVGWMVVTVSEDAEAVAKLRREGAILLFNAAAARICGG